MGTMVTVDVRDPHPMPPAVEAAVETAIAWLHHVDATFSTYRDGSEISRLGRGELRERECSPEVREVLGLCAEVERRSEGCFDIHCGGRLDPSGLVKGWSVQRAAELLRAAGARSFFIGAGGDIVLETGDLAVATSGTYERGEHILDPRTGRAPEGLLSMTVVGPSLTYADAFATAAFVMGEPGLPWVAGIDGYEGLGITRDRRAVWTPGMAALLVRDIAPAM